MKAYGKVDVLIHVFLTLALAAGEWSTSRLDRFTPGERVPYTHLTGDWVGPRSDLDYMKKNPYRDWNADSSAVQPLVSRRTDWAIPGIK
jgi:hypothetical protein